MLKRVTPSVASITIRVVKLPDGRYAGKTFSDAFNLAVLLADFGMDVDVCGFKAYRELARGLGFKLHSCKADAAPAWDDTQHETYARIFMAA